MRVQRPFGSRGTAEADIRTLRIERPLAPTPGAPRRVWPWKAVLSTLGVISIVAIELVGLWHHNTVLSNASDRAARLCRQHTAFLSGENAYMYCLQSVDSGGRP